MRLSKASIFLFHLLNVLECRFPTALQFTGDKAVLRFDDVILTFRSRGLLAKAFHTQLPVAVEALAFLSQLVSGGETQFHGSWLQCA